MTATRLPRRSVSPTPVLILIPTILLLANLARADTSSGSTALQAAAADTHSPGVLSSADRPAPPDPVELLRAAQQRCEQEVRDYHCVFLRQERIGNKLTQEQAIDVLYRAEPRSVYMTWTRNADRVKRALYIKGLNLGKHGEEQVRVEPAGVLIRLVVDELSIPVSGREARKSSRYTIDQFGFHAVLARINHSNERFEKLGVLRWTYEGEGVIDGRPTYVLVRHLPYTGSQGQYPDARLVVHLDQQWQLPVAVYSYADEQEQVLLGSYVSTKVDLNPGIPALAFRF
jgi:hypothetical protein